MRRDFAVSIEAGERAMWFKRTPSHLVLLAVLLLALPTVIVSNADARPFLVPIPLGEDDGGDNGDPGQGEKLLPDPVLFLSSRIAVDFPTRSLFDADLAAESLVQPVVMVPTVFAPKVQLPGLVFSIELLSKWNVTR